MQFLVLWLTWKRGGHERTENFLILVLVLVISDEWLSGDSPLLSLIRWCFWPRQHCCYLACLVPFFALVLVLVLVFSGQSPLMLLVIFWLCSFMGVFWFEIEMDLSSLFFFSHCYDFAISLSGEFFYIWLLFFYIALLFVLELRDEDEGPCLDMPRGSQCDSISVRNFRFCATWLDLCAKFSILCVVSNPKSGFQARFDWFSGPLLIGMSCPRPLSFAKLLKQIEFRNGQHACWLDFFSASPFFHQIWRWIVRTIQDHVYYFLLVLAQCPCVAPGDSGLAEIWS